MPVPCRVSIDAGTAITVPASASVVIQGSNSSAKPTRLKRIEIQSSQTGSNQQVVTLQLVTYATGTASGGTARTAAAEDDSLVGVYAPATSWYAATATIGTTPTVKKTWQWNTANPFDYVAGLLELQTEFAVSKVWAIIIPVTPPGGSFSLTGTVNYEEFG